VKLVFVAATPLSDHAKVRGKLAEDEPFAVRLTEPVVPRLTALAAGDCEAQVGGTLRTTVQLLVAVLEPLLAVTVNVLLPEFNDDESKFNVEVAPERALPLSDHVSAQLGSFGVMLNAVLVEPTLLTRVVATEGTAPDNVHEGKTFTDQSHSVVS
jgi:hypothetical protein